MDSGEDKQLCLAICADRLKQLIEIYHPVRSGNFLFSEQTKKAMQVAIVEICTAICDEVKKT